MHQPDRTDGNEINSRFDPSGYLYWSTKCSGCRPENLFLQDAFFYSRKVDRLFSATHFLKYKLLGDTAHDVHSPFLFDLLNTVIRDDTPFYVYDKIQSLRARLTIDESVLEVTDYGTGGESNRKRKLKVNYIAGHFVKPARYGQLLFRLVNHFHPRNIIELGTSLGITTLYLATPDRRTRIQTLEGCAATAAKAKENFELFEMQNISQVIGEFSQTLPQVLDATGVVDFMYFDGNHRKAATLSYWELSLPHAGENSIFVLDDIH
ncbi:MAG TPA: class I SAM-dependent methyltransferase, partial [Bacteroidia bacterium]|nr:class I SAM-dependent methyltransferase [Bacteroidia bacterium]